MELLRDAIFIRGVQSILIILASILFLYIGYKLFHYGIDKGRNRLRHQTELYRLVFSGIGPGLVFMVFGGFILVFSIISFRTFSPVPIPNIELSSELEELSPSSLVDISRPDSTETENLISAAVIPSITESTPSSSRSKSNKPDSQRKMKRSLKTANLSGSSALKSTYRNETELSRVINNHNSAIEYCYKREARQNPNLQGDIDVEFTIGYNGRVKSVRIVRSSMYNKKIEKCVTGRILGWRFKPIDPKDGDVKVKQKYIFG